MRADESLVVRGKIVGKLLSNTNLTDEDIYEIVGLGEEKWIEHIKYLRGQYEKGKNEGKRKAKIELLIYRITGRYGDLPEKLKQDLESMDYGSLKQKFDTTESLEELIDMLGFSNDRNKG